MNNSKKPVSRKENIVVQDLDDEILVYDLNKHKAFCLNGTAAFVWQMCDGKNDIGQISKGLAKKTKSTVNEDLIWLAIEQLKKDNLLANPDQLVSGFEGMNRREVIKRIGLGTMVALPMVAGITAPLSVNAASLGRCGTACTTNANCASPSTCGAAPTSSDRFCNAGGTSTNRYPTGYAACVPTSIGCASAGIDYCCSRSGSSAQGGSCGAGEVYCRCN